MQDIIMCMYPFCLTCSHDTYTHANNQPNRLPSKKAFLERSDLCLQCQSYFPRAESRKTNWQNIYIAGVYAYICIDTHIHTAHENQRNERRDGSVGR